MGLRKSRHSGDWRTKSSFQNKEEEFSQPLKGFDTVLEKGTTIRGAGGLRVPAAKTGDGVVGTFKEPMGGQASTSANVALIRSLGKSLALPKSVQERRTFDEVSRLIPGDLLRSRGLGVSSGCVSVCVVNLLRLSGL